MEKMLINVIESSSTGNFIILFDGKTYLFLDFGSNPKIIKNALINENIDKNKIAGCLITHSHIDHIQAINDSVSDGINFFSSYGTIESIKCKFEKENKYTIINSKKWLKIKDTDWKFKSYKTIHNCTDSVCFVIKNKNIKILYLTDTKFFINKKFKNLSGYIIESNYGSEYINDLNKKRVHLLNDDRNHLNLFETEKLFQTYYGRKTKFMIFSHISSNISDFSLIEDVSKKISEKYKITCKWINPKKINQLKIKI